MTVSYSTQFLESIRKILNETRQDRLCRAFLAERRTDGVIPYLGSSEPVYFFLGLNPAGYDLEDVPESAEEFIDYASNYFSSNDSNLAPFANYLPFTANHTQDYEIFGQVAAVAHVVPIPTRRSSEVSQPVAAGCWGRVASLIQATRPKLMLAHGSSVWKLLAGIENEPRALDLPQTHRLPLKRLYGALPGDQLPFQSRLADVDESYRPWILPLYHLGSAGSSKAIRDKEALAADQARRLLYGRPARARVRVRKTGTEYNGA